MENSITPSKRTWYHLYYFLAVFNLLTISATLYRSYSVLGVYSNSVEIHAVWSDHVSQYTRLNELAAAVNAPGNNVFDSGDIVAERHRLDQAYQAFQQGTAAARHTPEQESATHSTQGLLQQLVQIDQQVGLVYQEAISVFTELENNRDDIAGARMAEMDRCFSESLGMIGALCESVREIQSTRFEAEAAQARWLSTLELIIAGAVCFILCVVTWYGYKMANFMCQNENQARLDKHRAETLLEQLRASEQKSRILLNGSPVCNKIIDLDSRLQFMSAAGLDQLKIPDIEPFYGKTYPPTLYPEAMRAPLIEHLERAKLGETCSVEGPVHDMEGNELWYHSTFVPARDDQGKIEYIIVSSVNVTERHKAETELANSKEAAEAANRAKSEFLANMSHEIRTPMTAILGFTDILLDSVSKPQNVDAARTIKQNGESLIGLINDILDLSKIEAGKYEIEKVDCSAHQIIHDVTSLMRVRATAKGLPLDVQFDGQIPETIHTDPTRLRQVLINILGNAIKFTETGSVKIVTRLLNESGEQPKLQFNVTDTGIGIAEDKIEKLFSPFTQADSSMTRDFGGTGLGLSISKRLTELLGGECSVTSTIGQGSTFTVTIDTGSLENVRLIHFVDNVVKVKAEQVSPAVTQMSLHNFRILVAEDGPDNQRLIGYILKKAGAEVTLAENGQIAFDLATTAAAGNPFDVILMDMQMPELDGYAATRKLRDHGYSGPVIALTAHAMNSDRQKCQAAGCNAYTTKPIDQQALIRLIAEQVEKARDRVVGE